MKFSLLAATALAFPASADVLFKEQFNDEVRVLSIKKRFGK
jgi:hypothetical protein